VNPMPRGLGTALAVIVFPLAAFAQTPPPPSTLQPPPVSMQPPPSALQSPPSSVQQPAQPIGPTAGIEFQLATEFLSPNDSRITGGSTVFRLGFRTDPASNLTIFYERFSETFSFKNGGLAAGTTSAPVAPGQSDIEGVGVALGFGATRLEIMAGRANTTVTAQPAATPGTSLSSSDPVMDLGFFWTYHPGSQRALIDLGLVYRQEKLSGALPGNTIAPGSTQAKQLNDLGGLVARLGIGYAF
jgi:hypothetical protein